MKISLLAASAISLAMLLGACGNRNEKNSDSAAGQSEAVAFLAPADSLSLPLPQPPASITDPTLRADFVMTHFWDRLEINNPAQIDNEAFLEQNFANYCSLLGVASEQGIVNSARALLQLSSANPAAFTKIMEVAEKYLADPNSPMRNENAWTAFLENALALAKSDDPLRERWTYDLQRAKSNSPGSIATNFDVITDKGAKTNMLSLGKETPQRAVIFYDTECDNCTRILDKLRQEPALSEAIKTGKISVVTINATASAAGYSRPDKIAPEWIDAVAVSSADKNLDDIYDLRAMPVIYLLDSSGRVLGKDITPMRLLNSL